SVASPCCSAPPAADTPSSAPHAERPRSLSPAPHVSPHSSPILLRPAQKSPAGPPQTSPAAPASASNSRNRASPPPASQISSHPLESPPHPYANLLPLLQNSAQSSENP